MANNTHVPAIRHIAYLVLRVSRYKNYNYNVCYGKKDGAVAPGCQCSEHLQGILIQDRHTLIPVLRLVDLGKHTHQNFVQLSAYQGLAKPIAGCNPLLDGNQPTSTKFLPDEMLRSLEGVAAQGFSVSASWRGISLMAI